jgi:transposase
MRTIAHIDSRGVCMLRIAVRSYRHIATGVYWIPLYDVLEERGFEVYRPAHQESAGRKSDVQESQWLLKLHTYGLLNNSFQPPSEIRVLRTYWRQRAQHVSGAASCVQRMQKTLTLMNVQLANVISDLSGVTGQMIVRAVVAVARDPRKLAELSHPRIQASRGEIAKSPEGPTSERALVKAIVCIASRRSGEVAKSTGIALGC